MGDINKFSSHKLKGFTLLEILVYTGILMAAVALLFSFVAWVYKVSADFQIFQEVNDGARRVMEIIISEVRAAKSIYFSTSNNLQLSLETVRYTAAGETTSFIDFFLCAISGITGVCMKKEGQAPLLLSPSNLTTSNLVFNYIATDSSFPSVEINLTMEHLSKGLVPSNIISVNIISAVSLRSY